MNQITEKPVGVAVHKNVHEALSAAQGLMIAPDKNAENQAFTRGNKATKYADLSAIVESVRGPLSANGCSWGWRTIHFGEGLAMEAWICHGASGTEISCAVPLIVGKNDMHGFKSAVTYAKRIGLESVSGQAPADAGDDDDGNAAVDAAPREKNHRDEPPFDPLPLIAAINAANTGRDLIAAINAIGGHNSHPQIVAARVERLRVLVKGAQSPAVLDAFAKNFAPDWQAVEADATARRNELTPPAADLGGDEIPY